jgi:hypothetical protein
MMAMSSPWWLDEFPEYLTEAEYQELSEEVSRTIEIVHGHVIRCESPTPLRHCRTSTRTQVLADECAISPGRQQDLSRLRGASLRKRHRFARPLPRFATRQLSKRRKLGMTGLWLKSRDGRAGRRWAGRARVTHKVDTLH